LRSCKLLALFILLFPSIALAWCDVYTVKKGDTYRSISEHYFKDTYYTTYLKYYNKSQELVPGTKIPFFIPKSKYDWTNGCKNRIVSRLTSKKAHKNLEDFTEGIPNGLTGVAILSDQEDLDAMLALDLCTVALAIAEVSTNYGLLEPAKGKLSVYSLDPAIPIEVLEKYGLMKQLKENKVSINHVMAHVADATMIFTLYFSGLFAKNKSFAKTLLAYFHETEVQTLAILAYSAYLDILKIRPYGCSLEDGDD
jgi:hypothetical protein